MKKRKKRSHQKKTKKKRDKKYKGAAAQSASAKESNEKISYGDAIDYLSGYRASIDSISNQITNLTSPWYQPSISNALSGISAKLTSFNSFQSMLPRFNEADPISQALSLSRDATLAYAQLSTPMTVNRMASIISPTILDQPVSLITNYFSMQEDPEFARIGSLESGKSLVNMYGAQNLSAFSIQSDFALGTECSLFAEKSLSGMPWTSIGQKANLTDSSRDILGRSFLGLSESYSSLLDSYVAGPESYVELTPVLRKHTPIDYYISANLLGIISKEEEIVAQEEILKNKIQYENEITSAEYLPQIHPGLHQMWKGVVETFQSNNSDKQRQFITSLRELFTHLMHKLAPDEQVSSWTSDTTMFNKGKPTRRARLNYILRNLSNESYKKYLDKEIQATTAFMDVFQTGTHSIEDKFAQSQLIGMKSKAETTLKFLLEIEFSVNR